MFFLVNKGGEKVYAYAHVAYFNAPASSRYCSIDMKKFWVQGPTRAAALVVEVSSSLWDNWDGISRNFNCYYKENKLSKFIFGNYLSILIIEFE